MNSARDFRVLVCEVAEKLAYSDCETLRFIYGLPERERERGAGGLHILRTLHRQGVYTDGRELSEVLRAAHREDLAKEVESFQLSTSVGSLVPSHSPAQLRVRCDADAALARSLAEKLQRVGESIPNTGLPREALEGLSRELEAAECALRVISGRCEDMNRFRVADSGRRDGETEARAPKGRSSPSSRPIPAPRRKKGNTLGSYGASAPSANEREKVQFFTTHHVRGSTSCDGLSVHYYAELPGGGDGVWRQQYEVFGHCRRHHNQSSLRPGDSTAAEMNKSRTIGRPTIPKKPAWMARSSSVDGLDSDQPIGHTSILTDSGYSSVGNLLSEWTFVTQHSHPDQ